MSCLVGALALTKRLMPLQIHHDFIPRRYLILFYEDSVTYPRKKVMDLFIKIPGSYHDIRINPNGVIRSFEKGVETPATYKNKKGYLCSWFKCSTNGTRSFRIHRMVAELFLAIPETHAHIPLEELQVNHKDGIKENNSISNLEWVTNLENMQHARSNGLFSNEKPVLAKNVFGHIQRFNSISDAARNFKI